MDDNNNETFSQAYDRLNKLKKHLSKHFTKFKGIGGWYPISALDQPERNAKYSVKANKLLITRSNGLVLEFELS